MIRTFAALAALSLSVPALAGGGPPDDCSGIVIRLDRPQTLADWRSCSDRYNSWLLGQVQYLQVELADAQSRIKIQEATTSYSNVYASLTPSSFPYSVLAGQANWQSVGLVQVINSHTVGFDLSATIEFDTNSYGYGAIFVALQQRVETVVGDEAIVTWPTIILEDIDLGSDATVELVFPFPVGSVLEYFNIQVWTERTDYVGPFTTRISRVSAYDLLVGDAFTPELGATAIQMLSLPPS